MNILQEETIDQEELKALGVETEEALAKFLRVANGLIGHGVYPKNQVILMFAQMIDSPKKYAFSKNKLTNLAIYTKHLKEIGQEIVLSDYGRALVEAENAKPVFEIKKVGRQTDVDVDLREEALNYKIYGASQIEQGALDQMQTAMKLPISVAGALMPDAHQGYGLPIGGVLATTANTIIPYAVGVDIACRMCMSIFDLPANMIQKEDKLLKKVLTENTFFGMGTESGKKFDDSLFDRSEWGAIKIIRDLKDKAYRQLGTSGTGNHFVEWGILEILAEDDLMNIPKGSYLTLLSHSGSRGLGGNIANHYSKIAMNKTRLPKEAKHLAWLDMNTDEGQEYWLAMNLAGDYASANHHEIHNKIARAMNQNPLKRIENHHNFAWKEQLADGTEIMVHRKGATPAGANDLGIIPSSMTQPGFVIRGKGIDEGINSASHGAGRRMSRTKALGMITKSDLKEALEKAGVQLIGADLDEAPQAYKDINKVMAAQEELVKVLAKFSPKIVRMADGREKAED
ncbi:RtcB family protein [Arcicella rosea]|uniref:3'-phosphate/5'-hydroxy nucleic acid ligase n=1 Tax=Arcicella rosea TaxID=502909 RepID=A0A841EW23_9BACT|nr:RtcB family protein [Arcicella rosea]MBB6003671.1 tRNA-splicing ligase RtcB [Arcicella rosea]